MQIFVTVKFENRKDKIVKEDNKYLAYIKSLHRKGEANKEIIKEFAKYFKVDEDKVKIVSGTKSCKKIIAIKKESLA